jgi:hypothetical protein
VLRFADTRRCWSSKGERLRSCRRMKREKIEKWVAGGEILREFKALRSARSQENKISGMERETGRENFGPRIASPKIVPIDATSPLFQTQEQQQQQTICRKKVMLCERYSYHTPTQKAVLTVCAEQKLKASLWFSIGKIVDEETLRLNTNATPQFIGALTEMVWSQIGILAPMISRKIVQR